MPTKKFSEFTAATSVPYNAIFVGRDPALAAASQNIKFGPEVAFDLIETPVNNGNKVGRKTVENTTTTGAQTELFVNGTTTRMVIPSDTLWLFDGIVSGRRTDVAGDVCGFLFRGLIKNIAGTTSIEGAYLKTILVPSLSWDAIMTADDTNDALVCQVTGQGGRTIEWAGSFNLLEIG